MKLEIIITKEELLQAAENLVYTQSLDKDTEADEEAIAVVIKEHLEEAIEDILSNPENYLKAIENWIENINDYPEDYLKEDYKFWKKIDKAALEAERSQAA